MDLSAYPFAWVNKVLIEIQSKKLRECEKF